MGTLLEDLKNIDVDVANTMKRFLDNEALFKKFLLKFPADNNIDILKDQISQGQYDVAASTAHTLKGVTGNLGLTPMYEKFTEMVENLRNNEYGNLETLYTEIVEYYEKFCAVLKNHE